MELTLLICRLFLAVMFTVAAFAKLRDRDGTIKAANAFGVPPAVAPLFAVLLPLIELTVAALLLFAAVSWFGAVAAIILLGTFSVAISIQLAKGNAADCHCFGQWSGQKITKWTLLRNILFLVPAIVLALSGTQRQGIEVTEIDRSGIIIIIGLCSTLFLGIALSMLQKVFAKQQELLERFDLLELSLPQSVERTDAGSPQDGLPIGAVLPEFELTTADEDLLLSTALAKEGRGALLFFVSPNCGPCRALIPKIEDWAFDLAAKVDTYLISSGTAAENRSKFGLVEECTLLRQNGREFADAVSAKWTPSAMFVNDHGVVASRVAAGDEAITALVESIQAADVRAKYAHFTLANGNNKDINRITVGDLIPAFETTAMNGEAVSSEQFRGRPTLVTFWSPDCPHCKQMAASLREWDAVRGPEDPQLVVFSSGEAEKHEELGIRAPVVLDDKYKIAGELGMFGTPSAILIDAEGRFASEIAIGAPYIWALIGRTKK
ncbi:MAG: redoxin domain-containing protein [Chloracidobacterium sp.]|nr:redoxin domain-containing protein [Chloracidobacterium sp.]